DGLGIKVVKELMGHSSIDTTQKFYTQVDAEHRAKAAAVLDELLASDVAVQTKEAEKTDVRQTYEVDFGRNSKKGQI
ncbi:MAG: hypothetical protein ACYSXD_05430, partial [Planctomycetota bacterium]